jgi:hypothetical protein
MRYRHGWVHGSVEAVTRANGAVRFGGTSAIIGHQACHGGVTDHVGGLSQRGDAGGDQLWPRVRELCPLPLLDHWQAPVMTLLLAQQAVLPAQFSQGPFQAWEISLNENDLASRLSGMIRANGLTPEP